MHLVFGREARELLSGEQGAELSSLYFRWQEAKERRPVDRRAVAAREEAADDLIHFMLRTAGIEVDWGAGEAPAAAPATKMVRLRETLPYVLVTVTYDGESRDVPAVRGTVMSLASADADRLIGAGLAEEVRD